LRVACGAETEVVDALRHVVRQQTTPLTAIVDQKRNALASGNQGD